MHAGRLPGTVSHFRAEQGTSLETPWRARAAEAPRAGDFATLQPRRLHRCRLGRPFLPNSLQAPPRAARNAPPVGRSRLPVISFQNPSKKALLWHQTRTTSQEGSRTEDAGYTAHSELSPDLLTPASASGGCSAPPASCRLQPQDASGPQWSGLAPLWARA